MNNADTEANRSLIQGIFAQLEAGNVKPFVDALSDGVRWTTPGHCAWSLVFEGKEAVLNQLLGPVRAQLVDRVHLTVRRVIADGEHVVVEAKGQAVTKTGKPYDNEYCFVYRIVDGKVAEVTEYMDTDLACSRLVPPSA
jgi:ketosteroid isomerase-like protein